MNWQVLEAIRGQNAVSAIWGRHLSEHFEPFKRAFLVSQTEPAKYFPCEDCGCCHEIIQQPQMTNGQLQITTHQLSVTHHGSRITDHHSSFRAVCTCDPWNCADVILSVEEVRVWELNWTKLARALCEVFGLNPKFTDLHIHQTAQIGSWSADAVPAILTVQVDSEQLREVICELAARLRQRFILLSPTSRHLDARCHEILSNADAGFFALENLVSFDGSLRLMRRSSGELFARFSAQPKEVEHDVARRAFALIQTLDSENEMKPPTLLAVFRLYCIEELSADHIARVQHCSKSTVIGRLNMIRDRTGVDPQDLRKVSASLKKIEEEMTDSRASHIHRKKMIYDLEEEA